MRVLNRKTSDGTWKPPPKPAQGAFSSPHFLAFRRAVVQHVGRVSPYTPKQFVETYVGAKRRMYAKATEALATHGARARHARIKAFIKVELHCKNGAVPRVISPRNPVYNAALGAYIKRVEKDVYAAIDAVYARKFGGSRTVFKGHSNAVLARDFARLGGAVARPAYVGLDAERFDQHVSAAALKYEHSFYNAIYRSPELARLLTMQIHNRCKAQAANGSITWRTKGGRMSGDMNTSLGNTLLMCAMMYAFLCEHGIRARLANNGDDCVLAVDHSDLPRLSRLGGWFTERGFTMKVEAPVYHIEQAEFCQSHCLEIKPGCYAFVRKHTSVASKDLHTTIALNTVGQGRAWAAAVADCGLASSHGVPVQAAFYQRLKQCNGQVAKRDQWVASEVARRREYILAGARLPSGDVDTSARVSYALAFGLSPGEQRAIEARLRLADFRVRATLPTRYGTEVDSRIIPQYASQSAYRTQVWLSG